MGGGGASQAIGSLGGAGRLGVGTDGFPWSEGPAGSEGPAEGCSRGGDVTLSYAREKALEERERLVFGEQGESR